MTVNERSHVGKKLNVCHWRIHKFFQTIPIGMHSANIQLKIDDYIKSDRKMSKKAAIIRNGYVNLHLSSSTSSMCLTHVTKTNGLCGIQNAQIIKLKGFASLNYVPTTFFPITINSIVGINVIYCKPTKVFLIERNKTEKNPINFPYPLKEFGIVYSLNDVKNAQNFSWEDKTKPEMCCENQVSWIF